jgi:hypothetical protein
MTQVNRQLKPGHVGISAGQRKHLLAAQYYCGTRRQINAWSSQGGCVHRQRHRCAECYLISACGRGEESKKIMVFSHTAKFGEVCQSRGDDVRER